MATQTHDREADPNQLPPFPGPEAQDEQAAEPDPQLTDIIELSDEDFEELVD